MKALIFLHKRIFHSIYCSDATFWDRSSWANSRDKDQTAPKEQSIHGLHCSLVSPPERFYESPDFSNGRIISTWFWCSNKVFHVINAPPPCPSPNSITHTLLFSVEISQNAIKIGLRALKYAFFSQCHLYVGLVSFNIPWHLLGEIRYSGSLR